MKDMPKVLFILGPTGAGKSSLAVDLALIFNGEIISADSVQIFKEFNIGSAKVTEEEKKGVVHYGIDIISPKETFSVYDYINYTKIKIGEILAKGKLPIIVGGTGLYVKSLIEGYNFGDTERHDDFRAMLEKDLEEKGKEYLFNKLKSLDPVLASKIDKNNPVRLIRALEIATFGSKQTKKSCDYDFKILAVCMDRQELYTKLNARVDKMIKDGLIEEVKNLKNKYGEQSQPMKAIGYKEVLLYLNGSLSKKETIELIKQHTRNYAKRQLTFLRGLENVTYIDNLDKEKALITAINEVKEWMKK